MKRSNIPIFFWILLSFFIMFFSRQFGLGEFRTPGPGLMPFLIGIFLLLISLYSLARSLLRNGDRKETLKTERNGISFWRVGFVLLSLFAFALLLERIGYLITSFLILAFLFRSTGSKGWRFALITSCMTALVTYLVFTYLGLRFPTGIFRLGGFLK